MLRKTKIVCTIGPASERKEVFKELVNSGLNVARLNFSHGDHEEHLGRMNTIKEVRRELGKPVAILLDTKGPEIRTGKFEEPVYTLVEGQEFTLTTDSFLGTQNKCQISYKGLPDDVVVGDKILIDDGLIELEVLSKSETEILTKVLNGGDVKNNKGVNVPGVSIKLPAITEKDINDIKFGISQGIDFIAASFIRKAADVMEIRKVLEENNGHGIHIISKIENQEGVDNLEEILEVSDGLMVARGDLGVEIPTEMVPIVQKKMIELCNKEGKPVITATQMLDSMIRNPRPTRAEATDVANAIFDGTDAVMLSGETAAGKYPIEAVQTMAKIAIEAERALNYKEVLQKRIQLSDEYGVTYAVSHSTATSALDLDASAIITATSSGYTARKVSMLKPKAPVIACTVSDEVCRKLALVWGVFPLVIGDADSTDLIFDLSVQKAKAHGFVTEGDLVIITAGVPVGVSGATNIMKIHLVGEVLIKGTGLVRSRIRGNVCVGSTADQLKDKFKDGDIIVASYTDKDMVPYLEKASGFVVEEGGYTSHGAIVALSLKKPCVVGASNATELLKDGMEVTLDSVKGIVYAGKARML
ncbi:pyruvate kinase [Fusibacter tunisiensis]|uniref:Pyruvate kinase n=1 Tax=Fusibacter tunisiensis TaxID=1008308 RepID=A0ABS2MRG5_9FIRM|nr:pyruvate kinase [Fusibacter tunisiensis]MBM7561979.1 pyruvate kinase [Fusibacter tunisiensis]